MERVCKLACHGTLLTHFETNQCFQDKSISTSLPVIDLIDIITPGAIREDMVKKEDLSPEDMLNNAKYVR